MLNQITNPTEYINAVSKLLPYAIGKKKAYEEIEELKNPHNLLDYKGLIFIVAVWTRLYSIIILFSTVPSS